MAALAAAALVAIALLVWRLIPRDEVRRVTLPQAVQAFRSNAGADLHSASIDGSQLKLGVYRYDTRGEETVDTSVVSGSHDYSGMSTITIFPGRCGVVERWQALANRWNESETCPGRHGNEVKSLREFHEFFGIGQADNYVCKGVATSHPSNLKPGQQIDTICKSAAGSVINEMEIEAAPSFRIDGQILHPIRVIGTSLIRGSNSGAAKFEDWRRRSDGLLLRRKVASHAESEANGGTQYSESYSIRLLSLVPER